MSRWLFAVAGLLVCMLGWAQTDATQAETAQETATGPVSSASDVEQGALVVRSFCSTCHGPEGTGGRGPDLTRKQLRHGNSDEAIFRNIQRGIPGTGMAPMPLDPDMIVQVVAFIRSRQTDQQPVSLPGDKAAGKQLFARLQCAACHWVGNQGGRRGTNLRISRGTVEFVRRAILDPDADIDSKYQRLTVVTTDGQVLHGLLLNEDAYHVQMIDEQEQLHTVARAAIDELQRPATSLMPSYRNELDDRQVDDLLAYLFSLREEGS